MSSDHPEANNPFSPDEVMEDNLSTASVSPTGNSSDFSENDTPEVNSPFFSLDRNVVPSVPLEEMRMQMHSMGSLSERFMGTRAERPEKPMESEMSRNPGDIDVSSPVDLDTSTLSAEERQKLEDFQCPICLETFIQPVKISCTHGHSFCNYCIRRWIERRYLSNCPVCRGNVSRCEPTSLIVLDELESEISEFYRSLPEVFQHARLLSLEERKEAEMIWLDQEEEYSRNSVEELLEGSVSARSLQHVMRQYAMHNIQMPTSASGHSVPPSEGPSRFWISVYDSMSEDPESVQGPLRYNREEFFEQERIRRVRRDLVYDLDWYEPPERDSPPYGSINNGSRERVNPRSPPGFGSHTNSAEFLLSQRDPVAPEPTSAASVNQAFVNREQDVRNHEPQQRLNCPLPPYRFRTEPDLSNGSVRSQQGVQVPRVQPHEANFMGYYYMHSPWAHERDSNFGNMAAYFINHPPQPQVTRPTPTSTPTTTTSTNTLTNNTNQPLQPVPGNANGTSQIPLNTSNSPANNSTCQLQARCERSSVTNPTTFLVASHPAGTLPFNFPGSFQNDMNSNSGNFTNPGLCHHNHNVQTFRGSSPSTPVAQSCAFVNRNVVEHPHAQNPGGYEPRPPAVLDSEIFATTMMGNPVPAFYSITPAAARTSEHIPPGYQPYGLAPPWPTPVHPIGFGINGNRSSNFEDSQSRGNFVPQHGETYAQTPSGHIYVPFRSNLGQPVQLPPNFYPETLQPVANSNPQQRDSSNFRAPLPRFPCYSYNYGQPGPCMVHPGYSLLTSYPSQRLQTFCSRFNVESNPIPRPDTQFELGRHLGPIVAQVELNSHFLANQPAHSAFSAPSHQIQAPPSYTISPQRQLPRSSASFPPSTSSPGWSSTFQNEGSVSTETVTQFQQRTAHARQFRRQL